MGEGTGGAISSITKKDRPKRARGNLPKRSEMELAYTPARIDEDARIIKANSIVEARYFLPLNAHRVLSLYLSLLKLKDDQPFPLMKIPLQHVADTFPGLSSAKSAGEDVSKALDQLFDAVIHVKNGENWIKLRWAPTCGREKGWIFVRLNDDLRPYLSDLARQFTQYRLRFVLELRTAYQYRFYELFKSKQFLRQCEVNLAWAKDWLNIPEEQYSNSSHFRDKVLEPAMRAINQVTDLQVKIVQQLKDSRRVVGWLISIREKPQEMLPLPHSVKPLVERMVADGLSPDEAARLCAQYDEHYLIEKIEYAERQFADGVARNLAAYLREAIVRDFRPPPTQQSVAQRRQQTYAAEESERLSLETAERAIRERRLADIQALRLAKAESLYEALSSADRAEVERRYADSLLRGGQLLVRLEQQGKRDDPLLQTARSNFLIAHFKIPEPSLGELQNFQAKFWDRHANADVGSNV